jgi:hypothetical protein
MKGKTVYLCGPIHGRTDAECITWRQTFRAIWDGEVLDPIRRDYRGREYEDPHGLVHSDLADVRAADALIVYYDKPSVGTSMEVFYASHILGKPVVLVNRSYDIIPVWMLYHADQIVGSLTHARAALDECLSAGWRPTLRRTSADA